jgi:DNA-binding transcriptional ArsR family regulator
MSCPLFHFEYQGETGWESLGSGTGDDRDATGSAFDDLRLLHGGEMPVGAYRYIEAIGEDARWQEFELDLDGVAVTPAISNGRPSLLEDREAAEIAKTLTHPLRLALLRVLGQGGKLSPVEFSRDSGESIGNVSHHMKALHRAGVIGIAETGHNRGAVVHRYSLGGPRAAAVMTMLGVLDGLDAVSGPGHGRGRKSG